MTKDSPNILLPMSTIPMVYCESDYSVEASIIFESIKSIELKVENTFWISNRSINM